MGDRTAVLTTAAELSRNRWFESVFLQRRTGRSVTAIACSRAAPALTILAPQPTARGPQIPIALAQHRPTNAGPRFPPLRLIRRLPSEPAALSCAGQASDNP